MKQEDVKQYRRDLTQVIDNTRDILQAEFPDASGDRIDEAVLTILERLTGDVFRQAIEETGATRPDSERHNF